MNSRHMDWLNQNRNRAYPLVQEEWRKHVDPESGLDCILLDALVVNAGIDPESRKLYIKSIVTRPTKTTITINYAGENATVEMSGGSVDGPESFETIRGLWSHAEEMGCAVPIALVFSSHEYIYSKLGSFSRTFPDNGIPLMPTRQVNLTEGHGVSGIMVNGSANVHGGGVISGDVVLEDGYRTSPVVQDGRVLVRTGSRYGIDPCHYPVDTRGKDCSRLLFFFCGQNAINSGNVNINGGRGITVDQGRKYNGIPCVEIKASKELLELYSPE